MQPTGYPVSLDALRRFWRSFIEERRSCHIADFEPDPIVLESWKRCLMRFDPHSRPRPAVHSAKTLESVMKSKADLASAAVPYLEDCYQFIEGSDCAVLLGDGSACVIQEAGDPQALERLHSLGLKRGTYWGEGQLGTNALGLSLVHAMPIQVVGAEHFFQIHHDMASTAAPVHDVRGRVMAIIAIVGPAPTATSHTLSLVMATARAIGNQLQTNLYLEEANDRLTQMNTVLGAIHEGVIAWDGSGKISHANEQAGAIFAFDSSAALGKPLARVIDLPPLMKEAIQKNSALRDMEMRFDRNGHPVNVLVNLHPIVRGSSPLPIGHIAMFRPIESVRRLVHRQVGAQATLTLKDIPAKSSDMRRVLRQAAIAARSSAPLLIRGEGGVGKNPLARAVHNAIRGGERPFIALDCRAIPHELMLAEFLGYDQDAGNEGRPSKFELAHGGTLLLDQVESLSLETQSVLLHMLETGSMMRLSSTRQIQVDVRLIASSAADIETLVADGSFLRELYFEFFVFSIYIPPLRERPEDIPILVDRFLARVNQGEGPPKRCGVEALAALRRYPWPGNTRELENVLERAVHHSTGDLIRVLDLPEAIRSGRLIHPRDPTPRPALSLAEAEREAIIRAGWVCQGRITEMARLLKVGRTTLWRKLKELDISSAQFKRD